jgi:hypothetical protein
MMTVIGIIGLIVAAIGLISPPILLWYQNILVDRYEAVCREVENDERA